MKHEIETRYLSILLHDWSVIRLAISDRWTLTLRRTSSSIYVHRLIQRLYKISNYDDLSLRNRFVEPLKTSSKETYTVESIEEISIVKEVLDSSIKRKWKAEWSESREWKVTNVKGHGTVIFVNIKLCCVKRTKFFMKYTLSVLREDRHTAVLQYWMQDDGKEETQPSERGQGRDRAGQNEQTETGQGETKPRFITM